jgi:hypothetical protein
MADSDIVKPVLTALTLPGSVELDVDLPLRFSVGATDDSSGIKQVAVTFDRAIGSSSTLVFDSFTDGAATLQQAFSWASLGQGAGSSNFNVTAVQVTDKAGNVASYSADDLAAAHMSTGFTLTDHTAPTLQGLTLPATVDVSNGASIIPLSLAVTENGSLLDQIDITLDRGLALKLQLSPPMSHGYPPPTYPVQSVISAYLPTEYHAFNQSILFYGGRNDAIVQGLAVNASAQPGLYHIASIGLTDRAGNHSIYDSASLQLLGIDTGFGVVTDTTAPRLAALSFAAAEAHDVSLTVKAEDVGAGIGSVVVDLMRSADGSLRTITLSNEVPTPPLGAHDTFVDGTRTMSIGFSSDQLGQYQVTGVNVIDKAGNVIHYNSSQLSALGATSSFRVGSTVTGDLDGNGHSDILWLNRNGAVSSWLATGSDASDAIRQNAFYATVDPSWTIASTFDWNGDGAADILWRNRSGEASIWTADGGSFRQAAYGVSTVGNEWQIADTADLNGDNKADILWRNQDGAISSWLSTGTGFQQNAYYHGSVGTSWKVEGLGDFNGDGRADILWRNDDGSLSVWNSTGSGFQEGGMLHAAVDRSWHVADLGDFNGDGRADILWRNDNGSVSVWRGSTSDFDENQMNASASTDWKVAQVGNYSGDGLADILWRNASGAISIWHSNGSTWQQNSYYDASVGGDWSIAGHDFQH